MENFLAVVLTCVGDDNCEGLMVCAEDGSGYGECDCSKHSSGNGGSAGQGESSDDNNGGTSTAQGGTSTAQGGTSTAQGGTSTAQGGTSTAQGGTSTAQGGTSTTRPYRRAKECDSSGANCTCTTVASLGSPASRSYGNAAEGVPDTVNAFHSWLLDKSNLQSVQFYTTKPAPLTAAWLAQWDVLILQDLRSWSFSADEIAAFRAWVKGGGGVIALSGYFSDNNAEIVQTNTLLYSTGMQLLATAAPGQDCSTAIAESNTVCPNSNASRSYKCFCWGNALPLVDWNTAHPIAANLTAIGGFRGRAVSVGSGTTVISFQSTPVGATANLGDGKVFLFGDETVTYESMWLTAGQVTSSIYNPCFDSTASVSCLSGHVFQYKQFWYNALKYVIPPSECTFAINEASVIP
jgi:hypothetical protein